MQFRLLLKGNFDPAKIAQTLVISYYTLLYHPGIYEYIIIIMLHILQSPQKQLPENIARAVYDK